MNKKKFRAELFWETPFLTMIFVLFYSVFIFFIMLLLAAVKNEKVILTLTSYLHIVLISFVFVGILTFCTCFHFMRKRKHYIIYYAAGASFRKLTTYITAKQYIMMMLSLGVNLLIVSVTECFYDVLHTDNSFRDLFCYSIAGIFVCYLLNFLVFMFSFIVIRQLHPFSERWER